MGIRLYVGVSAAVIGYFGADPTSPGPIPLCLPIYLPDLSWLCSALPCPAPLPSYSPAVASLP